jgi:hypothetical protein
MAKLVFMDDQVHGLWSHPNKMAFLINEILTNSVFKHFTISIFNAGNVHLMYTPYCNGQYGFSISPMSDFVELALRRSVGDLFYVPQKYDPVLKIKNIKHFIKECKKFKKEIIPEIKILFEK